MIRIGLILLLVGTAQAAWLSGPAPAYRVAAQLILSGQFDARVYDDAWFSAQVVAETNGAVSDILSPSPPTLPLLFLPIEWSSGTVLNVTWAAANLMAALSAIRLSLGALRRYGHVDSRLFAVISGVVLVSAPLQENLLRGQIYLFILLLHAIVFWAVAYERDRLAGVALALLLTLKINGLPIWMVLIALRRWRVLKWAVVSTLGLVAISLPITGIDVWRAYLTQTIPSHMLSSIAGVPAYQTVNGFFQHLFHYDLTWNPAPLFDTQWLASLGAIGVGVSLMAITWTRSRRVPHSHAVGAGVVLSAILSPQAEQYHFLILTVPFAVAVSMWPRWSRRSQAGLALAAVLVCLALPYKDPRLWPGAIAILAYPRLYGALILWGLLMFASNTEAVNHART